MWGGPGPFALSPTPIRPTVSLVSLRVPQKCRRSPCPSLDKRMLPFAVAVLRVPPRINPPTPETKASARLPPPSPSRNATEEFS